MARTRKIPTKVVNYEALDDELKALYNKLMAAYMQKSVFKLREDAQKLSVESPTMLLKEDLAKRIVGKIISEYLPPAYETLSIHGVGEDRTELKSERICDVFCERDNKFYVGGALVPQALLAETWLRCGDLVEGEMAYLEGREAVVAIDSVEGGAPIRNRRRFSQMRLTEGRELELPSESVAAKLTPGLKTGERVIVENMQLQTAEQLVKSFDCALGVFVGMKPEYEADIEKGVFAIGFDCSAAETAEIAHLVAERAKRLCERGNDVALIVYGFDRICDCDSERALFGAGRSLDGGSITVFADVDKNKDFGIFKENSTRIVNDTIKHTGI